MHVIQDLHNCRIRFVNLFVEISARWHVKENLRLLLLLAQLCLPKMFLNCVNKFCTIWILQEGPHLKSKGRASVATRTAVLTWRTLLIMSRDWNYFWIRLLLYMLLMLSIGTIFSNIGHSLSSVMVSLSKHFSDSCEAMHKIFES